MLKKIIVNTSFNYLLKALQLILSLVAIPILILGVGKEGFGIITFAAVLIGYFNIFELGITHGVTKYVAEYNAKNDPKRISEIINTSLGLFFVIGVFVCVIVLVGVKLNVLNYFNISKEYQEDGENVFVCAGPSKRRGGS